MYTKTSAGEELKRNQIGIKEQRQSRCTINTFAKAIFYAVMRPVAIAGDVVVVWVGGADDASSLNRTEPEQEHATTTTTAMSMMNETTRRKLKYSSPEHTYVHNIYQRDENEKGFNRSDPYVLSRRSVSTLSI